ncbi:MAG TPA: cytochrome c-type biogenesis protein CcmH, partial [Acidimicrobiia bacterium]|nr:cytochrome c-type biogenesis protein CcmH [Acidimicrobiia bacterium]
AYVDRFGEDILLSPPRSGLGAVVWLLPVTAFGVAAGGLALAFRRWRRTGAGAVPTDADRELVEQARAGQALEREGRGI